MARLFHCSAAALLFSVIWSSSANAQTLSPPNAYFSATGSMNLTKNENGGQSVWPCALNFNGQVTGPNTISISAWSTPNFNCPRLSFQPSTITITSKTADGGTGYIQELTVRLLNDSGGVVNYVYCRQFYAPIRFINNGASQTSIQIDLKDNTFGCNLLADMKTCPDVNVD